MEQVFGPLPDPVHVSGGETTSVSEPGLWFEKGVVHRKTGPNASFWSKPPELQAAIILAANRHRGDWWELLNPEAREEYLAEGRHLVSKGLYKARRARRGEGADVLGGEDRETPVAPPRTENPEPGVICILNDAHRVVDDPLQWVLQRCDGKGNWRGMMFFRTRDALLYYLTEETEAGECDPAGLEAARCLPDWHS
jgi:hypothetical protein